MSRRLGWGQGGHPEHDCIPALQRWAHPTVPSMATGFSVVGGMPTSQQRVTPQLVPLTAYTSKTCGAGAAASGGDDATAPQAATVTPAPAQPAARAAALAAHVRRPVARVGVGAARAAAEAMTAGVLRTPCSCGTRGPAKQGLATAPGSGARSGAGGAGPVGAAMVATTPPVRAVGGRCGTCAWAG